MVLLFDYIEGEGLGKTSLTGVPIGENGVTNAQKIWNASQALGNIAFAYSYAVVLVEIQAINLALGKLVFICLE